jgi:5-methylcytosine-specific restriction endonuclease McrA
MPSAGLSLDRLRDSRTISLFKRIFDAHTGSLVNVDNFRSSEHERFQIVPLVFGLIPARALFRERVDCRIKPLVREHLDSLGVAYDEGLVSTIKLIIDQYFESVFAPAHDRERPRKLGIESVRARRPIYRRLRRAHNDRCAVCGVRFGIDDAEETLDHILPWCLAGDPYDGRNWQLLCRACNLGKREWLSALQSPHALNWSYGLGSFGDNLDFESPEARYLMLSLRGECEMQDCARGPKDGRLTIVRRVSSGLPIADNLIVLCEAHADDSFRLLKPRMLSADESQIVEAPPSQPTTEDSPASGALEQFGDYLLVERIAGAGMARAYRAIDQETGERVFMKIVDADPGLVAALAREQTIYQKLDRRSCQHVLPVRELVRANGSVGLVCDCADGDLSEFVKERGGWLPTDTAKDIGRQIVEGLRELHELQIIHRDLKPSNILYLADRFLLTDFGISKDLGRIVTNRTFRRAGTSGYAAPEQLLSGREATASADIYSFGKVLVFMLTGSTDVDNVTFREWRRLIRRCTSDKSEDRPSLDDIMRELDCIEE